MRTLYVVPIIHTSADMGSLASTLNNTAVVKLAPGLWQRHKDAVFAFWDTVNRFTESLDSKSIKIYQDGLVADGADGMKIIREGISQGSKNCEIIGKLLDRGALLIKTESLDLVQQEYSHIKKMACARSIREREIAAIRYRLNRDSLLRQRDAYIAGRIDETLGGGETGLLFIGAEHDVTNKLPSDIKLFPVKEIASVREYHRLVISQGNLARIQQLADYLTSPVTDIPSN